jgi:proteasome lid subunit RPN8/RPN11
MHQALEVSLDEIYDLGTQREPAEACGLLLDTPVWRRGRFTHVVELPNRTLHTSGQYVIHPDDIRLTMEDIGIDEAEVAIWHTHPSGSVGPSVGDLACRPHPDIKMLVVALTTAGPVATWF